MGQKIDIMRIGGPFRWARKNTVKMSRSKLARILNITQNQIARLEHGKDILPNDVMLRIFNIGLTAIIFMDRYSDEMKTIFEQEVFAELDAIEPGWDTTLVTGDGASETNAPLTDADA